MDRLDELLLEWEARKDRGTPTNPVDMCLGDPALAAELAARIRYIELCDHFLNPPEAVARPIPVRVGKYAIRRIVGQGGMGEVFEGWDPALARAVAVKTIRPRYLLAGGRRAEARFAREGQVLAQLDHPNIVPVYDAGIAAGVPFLVMKYVPGGSLAAHREQLAAAGPGVVAPLMEKVARAVHYAHGRRVYHRDLKPGNVLLGDGGEPMVADFGLAKLWEPDADEDPAVAGEETLSGEAELTTTGGFQPGTPAYMAPEQADPTAGAIGPWTDVWALGIILRELLTGRRPAAGPDDPGEPPAEVRVPTRLAEVVGRCLERNPARRYRTAGDLADALRRARHPDRRAVLLGGAAAAGLAGAGWWLWPAKAESPIDPDFEGYTDPDAVRDSLARLGQGKAVTLIDAGVPRGYRVVTGTASGEVKAGVEGECGIYSNSYCLVELLPRLPPGEWLVEAVMRHSLGLPTSHVGLFAAHLRGQGPGGREHVFYSATFKECALEKTRLRPNADPTRSETRAQVHFLRESPAFPYAVSDKEYAERVKFWIKYPLDLPGRRGPRRVFLSSGRQRTRRVSVRVSANGLGAGWNGTEFHACSPDKLAKDLAVVAASHGAAGRLRTDLFGGVGVCVVLAGAAVQWVRVRPVKPNVT